MARRKVVLFIMEGPSDDMALGVILKKFKSEINIVLNSKGGFSKKIIKKLLKNY